MYDSVDSAFMSESVDENMGTYIPRRANQTVSRPGATGVYSEHVTARCGCIDRRGLSACALQTSSSERSDQEV